MMIPVSSAYYRFTTESNKNQAKVREIRPAAQMYSEAYVSKNASLKLARIVNKERKRKIIVRHAAGHGDAASSTRETARIC